MIALVVAGISAYLLTSPSFKIQEISIKGNQQLTSQQVTQLAEIKKGDNIMKKVSTIKLIDLIKGLQEVFNPSKNYGRYFLFFGASLFPYL